MAIIATARDEVQQLMTFSLLGARVGIGAAALAIISLATLHILKTDISPSQNMSSQYALGRREWQCVSRVSVPAAHAFLPLAAVGLAMAARFRMDPVSTPPQPMSFSGKMHSVSFLPGGPCMLLAVLLL